MRIICLFHPYTPSLSSSSAKGMFRFGDMVSSVSFLDYTYLLQIYDVIVYILLFLELP